jgi:phospholipase C
MLKALLARRLCRLLLGASVATLALSQGVRAEDRPDRDAQNAADRIRTASPIKHVIIIVGENRSFDHLFATYVPKSDNDWVLNLLSERIVKADGSPNENFDRAHQFRVTLAPNSGKYFISVGSANKTLYSTDAAPAGRERRTEPARCCNSWLARR